MSTPCVTANVHYLLTAEFDNKFGPVIRNQYPSTIPGFEYNEGEDRDTVQSQNNPNQQVFYLASLMIPNNAEYNTDDGPDTTIFMLYKNDKSKKYELFPARQVEEVLWFVNVVYAKEDESNSRGTKIKAIALGTKMVDFIGFRPFVLRCLHKYMRLENDVDPTPILQACFRLLNRVELSFVNNLHNDPVKQTLLRSIGGEMQLREWVDEGNSGRVMFKKLLKCHHNDKYTNHIALRRGKISITLRGYRPKKEYVDLAKIPLEFDVVRWGSIISWNVPYDTKISRFLLNFIPILRDREDDGCFYFRLIIYSSEYKGSELSRFIIALSNLIGFTNESGFLSQKRCLILPCVDIAIIDPLKKWLSSQDDGIFLIMGTKNPIFKSQCGLYDYYYDLDDELLSNSEAANDDGKNGTPNKWEVTIRKKLFIDLPPRIGFLQKMIESIDEQETDFFKIALAFQKINIMQLLQLEYRLLDSNPEILFDEYTAKYRDAVVFEDIFETDSLKSLHLLRMVKDVILKLYQPDLYLSERTTLSCQLEDLLSEIYDFISADEDSLEKFLGNCLRFPFAFPCSQYNLQEDTLARVSLKHELKHCLKHDKMWSSLLESPIMDPQSSILYTFNRDGSLCLICLLLLLNPNVEIQKRPRSEPPEITLKSMTNGSIRRHKSVNLKQMLKRRQSVIGAPPLKTNSEGQASSSSITTGGRYSTGESATLMSSKEDRVELRKRTKNIRALTYKIFCIINSHYMGKLIIGQSLTPFLKSILEPFKVEPSKESSPPMPDSSGITTEDKKEV